MKRLIFFLVISLIFIFVNAGCLERRLTIKSNPPGAGVYFNDKYIGETPVNFDFEWYWTHKVELKKEGFKTISRYETIKAPPYMWIPFDLVVELLPFKVRDYHSLTYNLEPEVQTEEEVNQEIEEEEFDFNR